MSNIYPYGQCTWWCADQEPWVERYGNLGNALNWAANWRAKGGFVQMTPSVGTVACFQPGSDGADAGFGHVAVVVAAFGTGFTVSEMNGPAGPGHTDDRDCTDNPGVSFLVENDPTPKPPAPIPSLLTGDEMALYQLANGTIYLITGGTLVPLGSGADAEYLMAEGLKLWYENKITPAFAAALAKLPIV